MTAVAEPHCRRFSVIFLNPPKLKLVPNIHTYLVHIYRRLLNKFSPGVALPKKHRYTFIRRIYKRRSSPGPDLLLHA